MQPSPARDVNVEGTEALISPVDLVNELPLTEEIENTVLEGRQQIEQVLRGEERRMGTIEVRDLGIANRLYLSASGKNDRGESSVSRADQTRLRSRHSASLW